MPKPNTVPQKESTVQKQSQKILSFRFLVEIDNLAVGGFSEVSGLEQSIETEEYKEGGHHFVHKLPKAILQSNLKLKSGMSSDDTLWQWFASCRDAVLYKQSLPKKNINISIFDGQQKRQAYFSFVNAYPIKWTGVALNASSSAIGIEELELVHEGMTRSL